MKKAFVFLLFLFCSAFLAQNVKIEGVVFDEIGPLEMANVMIINTKTGAMEGYSITASDGKYAISVPSNQSYTLKASYIGYQAFNEVIEVEKTSIKKDIKLIEGTTLDAIEIIKEMPVTIKGDTIVYNSDSFTNGTERKLEDVLKKLPGVEVNADGEIQVEGKTIQKVMVEGKDFFDGDSKIAVKNIPADALDKLEFVRNYSEVQNLKGLQNNEENVALNIKLKEGKKNFWFGDVTAGVGVGHKDFRYFGNPKLFYYSPKYSINLIGNFNNIGELPLTMQDYFKFTGGFRNMMGRSGTSFNISSNDLGIMGMRNNRAKEIDARFGAANFSYNPSKAWTLSGFAILSGNDTDLETVSRTNRIDKLPNGTTQEIVEDKTARTSQKNELGLFKLSSSYVPSDKVHFDYDVLAKVSNQREYNGTYSSLLSDIYTIKKQKPFSINQNLNYYYTLNDKNTFSFLVQHLYQDEDPFYNANLANQPFNLIGYVPGQTRNDITQNRMVKTNKIDAKADYYYSVKNNQVLNVTVGNTYSYQNFDSNIFQILDNNSQNQLTDVSNTNNVNYTFNDAFIGLHYRMKFGKFTLNPGVTAHSFYMNDVQLNSDNSKTFTKLLPDFNALWQIKKSETLSYDFRLTNNFTDINNLVQGYVFSNYNSLFSGNRNLENATSQVHSLRYFRYNMFNFENIFANLSYTKQTEGIKNRVLFDGVNQVTSTLNMPSNFADESVNGMASYGRSFLRYYKASVSGNWSWGRFNNLRVFDVNGNTETIVQQTENVTQNYSVRFSTNFKRLPNLELAYAYAINDNFADKVYTQTPSAKLEYFFLEAFSFTSEYTFYKNTNSSKTIENSYDFLTASLMYRKPNSKWEWKIQGTNLLNTTSLDQSSFSQLGGTSSYSSYIVQPRYVILSLKYNL